MVGKRGFALEVLVARCTIIDELLFREHILLQKKK